MALQQIRLSAFWGYQKQKDFNLETWAMSELYWSFIKDYDSNKIRKCNVIVYERDNELLSPAAKHLNVCSVYEYFDFQTYFLQKSAYEKK